MVTLTLHSLYKAWQQARAGKKPSHNQLSFESKWLDNLFALQESLQQGSWRPKPAVCFITTRPKCREIHAPDFADRVVHHWLVPQLERLYEPVFIYDSHANRQRHGTHLAVQRLQGFMRQVQSGQCTGKGQQGYALQLDVRNFFNRIHRPTLYRLLKHRLAKAQQQGKLNPDTAFSLQWLCHRLLAKHPAKQVYYRDDAATRALVPAHKQLANAPADSGLPIGNLTSQFFANVYLNELDQFIKHQLKCKHYVRYVDDFVLLHPDKVQLQDWQRRIEVFLAEHLKLALKEQKILKPIISGIDFLGYIVKPHQLHIRPRVLQHAKAKLSCFAQQHHHQGRLIANDDAQQRLHAQLVSYLGHAQHANKHEAIWRHWLTHYAWLQNLYLSHAAQLKTQHPKQASFKQQKSWFKGVYADIANQLIQRGGIYWHYQPSMGHCPIARIQAHRLSHYLQQLRQQQQSYILVGERTQGITAMQRAVCEVYTPFLHQEKTP